jgi:hypothetical protein
VIPVWGTASIVPNPCRLQRLLQAELRQPEPLRNPVYSCRDLRQPPLRLLLLLLMLWAAYVRIAME